MAGLLESILSLIRPKVVSPLPDPPDVRVMFPTPTSAPSPTPTPAPMNRYLNTDQYAVRPDATPIAQPPKSISDLLFQYFPNEASKAATVVGSENGSYNPLAYNYNKNGTGDYGMSQVNSATMNDYLRRFPDQMNAIGVNSVEDLKDIKKNILMMKLIRDHQGWGAWYGPGNKGYDVMGGE